MNAAVLDLARKIRTAEQQRFADSCMRASAEVRARWAGKGFGTATLNELTKLLNNLIDDRAKSLATEIARVLEAAPGALSNEDKAQLKSDYLTDIDR